MNKKFWKNKAILVTGFAGFLGSNLTKRLLDSGAKVTGLDVKIDKKRNFLSAADFKKITVVKGDVADFCLLERVIKKQKPEFVFHLAAEALVDDSLKDPQKAFSSNIKGTWSILEACRKVKALKAIIVASSDKAYGIHKKLPYTETASLQGIHPYDVSKSCADLIAHTYAHTYELPVAVTRCGNIYGPGDFNFSRIVPDTIRSIIFNKQLAIRSNGKFTRDYVYVDDIVNGYMLLAQKLKKLNLSGEAFNFSYEKPLSVVGLVKRISRLAAKNAKYRILNKAKYEIPHQYLSSQKARKILSWKPDFSLDESLKKTISWYKCYLDKR